MILITKYWLQKYVVGWILMWGHMTVLDSDLKRKKNGLTIYNWAHFCLEVTGIFNVTLKVKHI